MVLLKSYCLRKQGQFLKIIFFFFPILGRKKKVDGPFQPEKIFTIAICCVYRKDLLQNINTIHLGGLLTIDAFEL
jgi:hypothetical protein